MKFIVTEEEKRDIIKQYGGLLNGKSSDKNEEINEQLPGLKKFAQRGAQALTKMFKPDVQVFHTRALADLSHVYAPDSIKNLLTKFSVIKTTDFVKQVLRPVQNEITILANDIKRLQQFAAPIQKGQHDYLGTLKFQVQRAQDQFREGDKFHLDLMYVETKRIKEYIDDVIENKQVTNQGMTILNAMKQNADDALRNLEIAISQIAVK